MVTQRRIGFCLLTTLLLQKTCTAQCWTCTGIGDSGCQNASSAVSQPPSDTTSNNNLCMTKSVWRLPSTGSFDEPALIQVTRGFPFLETELTWMTGAAISNVTGTICAGFGTTVTCTDICYGPNCNDNTPQSPPTGSIDTKCLSCYAGNPNYYTYSTEAWQNCSEGIVDGVDVTTQACTARSGSGKDMGCYNAAAYNDNVMVSVYRGCGSPDGVSVFPGGLNIPPQTYGWCSDEMEVWANQTTNPPETISVFTCVSAYVADLTIDEPINEMVPFPGYELQCIQCQATEGSYNFDACLNYTATSGNDAEAVATVACNENTEFCSVTTLFDETTEQPIGIQRGCALSTAEEQDNYCVWVEDASGKQQVCQTTCTAGITACNSGNNEYVADLDPTQTPVVPDDGSSASRAAASITALLYFLQYVHQ